MTPAEIKQARIEVFGTQAKAAKHFHVTQSAWSHWEIGIRKMPTFYISALNALISELDRDSTLY